MKIKTGQCFGSHITDETQCKLQFTTNSGSSRFAAFCSSRLPLPQIESTSTLSTSTRPSAHFSYALICVIISSVLLFSICS
ncbi:unnamed protein product [Citrullus colocynthis]|uniref:Uncharacterized protein n=1 Tax=Citrullus colocynthis TaxID=252529 RepID=A0ABP0Y2Z6_9ROSI